MLSGLKILEEYENGNITIRPFNKNQLNPNSYNLRLDNKLLMYTGEYLDMRADNPTEELIIPEDGLILEPGKFYLGKTVEWTHTNKYVPCFDGRSSTARLGGIAVHICAGFGDVGFAGNWTLEITVKYPVKIYPNVEIAQIYYQPIEGDYILYNGKYQNSTDVMASKMYKDFE